MKMRKLVATAAAMAVLAVAAPMTGLLPDTVGMTAGAEENLTLGDLKFDTLENGTLSVSGLADPGKKNTITEIVIPSEVNGKSVTAVGYYAFSGCESLTSITLPAGVTSIDTGAFDSCKNLANITIPDSVISISFYTFDESLKNVYYKGSEEQWKKIDCYYPGPGGSHCTLGSEADDMMKLLGAETVQEYLLGKAVVHFKSAVPVETTSGDTNNSGSPESSGSLEGSDNSDSSGSSESAKSSGTSAVSDKRNPNTGVTALGVTAGVLVLTGAVVLVTRKRR